MGEFGGEACAMGFQRVPLAPIVCCCHWGASCDCGKKGFTVVGFGRRAGTVDEGVNGGSKEGSSEDAGTSGGRGGRDGDRGRGRDDVTLLTAVCDCW